MTMRVFMTGASGFIGAHLVPILLNAGCEVAVLALPDDPMERLKETINQVRVIRGELNNMEAFAPLLTDFRPDACIHLAWYVEPGKYLDSSQNITYLVNSLRLLEMLIQINCQQVVMTGTCAEYDTDIGYLRETSPTKPTTIYAAAKLSLGIFGQQLSQNANIRFTWARLFYLYGKSEDKRRVVPAVINSLLHDESFAATTGEQVRDFLHVEDVASALWFIVEHQLSGVLNISSGIPITIRALMEMIGEILGKTNYIQFGAVSPRHWEPMFICGDNRKLREHGWQPRITLREGLEDTIRWWRLRQNKPV
jgi:nucleoside-diphosphate-sugar epimerase